MISGIFISFLLIYTVLIILFEKGWTQTPLFSVDKKNKVETPFLSVIVCARNEEDNLPSLLSAIEKQSYKNFELIIVNDHSSDETGSVIRRFIVANPNFRIVNAEGEGKKSALKEGIAISSGEIIVQIDADCIPPEKWLETIAAYFEKSKSEFIIGAVKMESSSPFEEMQALEFMSLVASGAGAAGIDMPIMCNGANLAYKRSLWDDAAHAQHQEFASGDDMFLLLSAKKSKKKITFLKSADAVVTTKAQPTLSGFLNQRRRWASKSPGYRDFAVLLTAFTVLGLSVFFLLLLFTAKFKLLLLVFLWKALVDFFFLSTVAPFFGLKKCLKWVLPVAAIYPFYIAWSAFSGIFRKNKW